MKIQTLEAQILDFLEAAKWRSVAPGSGLVCDVTGISKKLEIETIFTAGVDFLRSRFPNPVINRLASVIWETVGQKITPVAWGLEVRTLSFVVVGSKSAPQGMIIPPQKWAEMVAQDPITQMGALVLVGSQAVDFSNDRFMEDQANVVPRASAYEAEFLNTVRSLSASWEPCPYQTKVLTDFPDGLATPRAQRIAYTVRPLVLA